MTTHSKYAAILDNWIICFAYLTSWSDLASIQYTLHFFRREPKAISCDTLQPCGSGGRLGICPVQCAMANISGASLTNILPDGVDRPGSYCTMKNETSEWHKLEIFAIRWMLEKLISFQSIWGHGLSRAHTQMLEVIIRNTNTSNEEKKTTVSQSYSLAERKKMKDAMKLESE